MTSMLPPAATAASEPASQSRDQRSFGMPVALRRIAASPR